MDLPQQAPEHLSQPDELRGMTIKAGGNVMIFKKEI
jgi:hypothetical protein